MPFSDTFSRRAPVPIQSPMLAERTCGIGSVITRTPFGRVVRVISRAFETEEANHYVSNVRPTRRGAQSSGRLVPRGAPAGSRQVVRSPPAGRKLRYTWRN